MSQKSSDPQAISFVSQPLKRDTDHAINACGRLGGVELPTFANTEASFPELEERVAKTIEFIKAIKLPGFAMARPTVEASPRPTDWNEWLRHEARAFGTRR